MSLMSLSCSANILSLPDEMSVVVFGRRIDETGGIFGSDLVVGVVGASWRFRFMFGARSLCGLYFSENSVDLLFDSDVLTG